MTDTNTESRDESPGAISRRQLLRGTAAGGLLSMLPTGASAEGQTEIIIRAETVDVPLLASSTAVVDELEATAAKSQKPIVEYIRQTDGLAVKNQFWLANALLVEVDTSVVDAGELAAQKGVSEVHANFRYEIPETVVGTAADGDAAVTYGLDQIDAPTAWDAYGSRGEGARVAVLDTGVDPAHPDIDLRPDHFAEFDADGNAVESEPHDSHYHGTHVSGTVSGGDASGTAIGVAPEATLLGGLILPDGTGTFAQIIGGMQWAVEQDADAINMSLGVIGYVGELIEPVRNAERAGTLVVSSSGNSGENTSGSPANVYDSFAVGATNEAEAVASFSSGEAIATNSAWGRLAPDDWPDEYVVPDASAPGVDVMSAYPVDHADGPYHKISGTSMASPHIAGLVGLLASAAGEEYDTDRAKAALTTSAWKPDGQPDEPDARYGHGVVDALAAVGRFAADGGVRGTVTDTDANPIVGATVELDGFPTETNADGEYTLRAIPGTYELSVDAFGYAAQTVTVEVGDGFASRDFALGDDLAVTVVDGQPDGLQAGESFDLDLEVANLDALTVQQVGDYEGDAWLAINDESAALGERVTFDDSRTGSVPVTVETDENAIGDLELEWTLEGAGETATVATGPTSVYENPAPVAIVDAASGGYAAGVRAILEGELHPRYQLSVLEPAEALAAANEREHEGYVVQNLGDDEELIAEFASVATAPEVGVVFLDQFGEESNAVSQLSAATDDPQETFDAFVELAAPPIDYEVGRSHPALEGIAEAGDRVTVTEPDPVAIGLGLFVGGFHTYFEDYRGPVAGTTLAETAIGSIETGEALAVDDLSRIVLASSLGVGTLVDRNDVTPDGRALLASLVEHAAKTPPIEVVRTPAERIAPSESATAEIEVGDLVELTVDISGLKFLDKSDLMLHVDGERVAFGDALAYEEYEGTVEATIETASGTLGEFALDAQFTTLDQRDREVETAVTFRPTTVYESPVRVPTQIDDLQAAVDFVRPGDAVEVADGTYALDAERGVQTGLYVGTPDITIRGSDGATVEIIHARDLPAPNVINIDADGVTIENLSANVVDGEIDEKNQIGHGIRINELVSDTTIRNVTAAATGGIFLDADVSNVHIEGVTVFDSPIGVGTDLYGGPVADVTITDLTFEDPYFFGWGGVYLQNATRVTVTGCDITYATGYDAGIEVFGDFSGSEDNRIANNSITGPDDDDPFLDSDNGIYVDGAEVDIVDNEIVDTYVGIRVAQFGFGFNPPSVSIENNTIENATTGFVQFGDRVSVRNNTFEAETGLHFDGGYFGLDADAVVARQNDLSKTDVPFVGEPDTGWGAPEGPFDARANYLGERDYGDTIADGDIAYDPFLTVPPADIDSFPPTEIATDLTLEPGSSYALGVPGPTDMTIWEILGVEGYRDFAGDVEFWNHDSERWQQVTGEGELQYVDSLYAFRVTPKEGVRAVVDFQRADDPPVGSDGTPPGQRDSEPGRTQLQKGTNFVAAPAYGDAGEVFDLDVVEAVSDDLASPASQFGAGERNAFTGYMVEASAEASLAAGLDAYDPTMAELYESLGLDPVIHDASGADTTEEGTTPTVADVLDAVADSEAADAVAALVGRRIGQARASADDSKATIEEIESVATAAVQEAPASQRDLVEEATTRVATEAIRATFGAKTVEEGDADYDSQVTQIATEEGENATNSIGSPTSVSMD